MAFVSAFTGMRLGAAQPSLALRQPGRPARPTPVSTTIEAAHKKGAGSTKNGRDSNAQRRGVKVYGGQPVKAGGIIVRQLGTKFHAGNGTKVGSDHTVFALEAGIVCFEKKNGRKRVSVYPEGHAKVEGLQQQAQPDSRRTRRLEKYTPRSQAD